MTAKETAKTLALAAAVALTAFVVATPLCIWIADVRSCERMTCEILVMSRPHADVSYCEAWFDLFRGD